MRLSIATKISNLLAHKLFEFACGIGGLPAVALMRADLDAASKAMIEGDLVAMVRICKKLQDN